MAITAEREGDVLLALDRDRVCVLECAAAGHDRDPVGLDHAGYAVHEARHDPLFVLLRLGEVELGPGDVDTDPGERLVGLPERVGGRHPGLGGDAADGDAGAADTALLDQHNVCAQLGRADCGRISTRSAAQNGDVTLHRNSLLGIASRSRELS